MMRYEEKRLTLPQRWHRRLLYILNAKPSRFYMVLHLQ